MLDKLIKKLQTHSGIESKKDIQSAAKTFSHSPFSELGKSAMLGDDAAVIPKQSGLLLMASEGISPSLVEKEPWFAGWSSVLVNISDIVAMGGKPLALVNSIWSDKNDLEKHNQILSGMSFACEKFNVPMVGGHSNQKSPYTALSVSILGLVDGPILSSRFAESEDELWIIANKDGCFFKDYPFWDAATKASATLLRKHFSLIPFLAKKNIIHAAKDISMGGITGTAVMFAESAGKTIVIDLSKNLDGADSVYCRIRNSIDEWISKNNVDAPKEEIYVPCWEPTEDFKGTQLECKNLAVVIWCTGYKSDFSWVDVSVFDGAGIPVHERGVTQSPGLYFLGLPWLYTWGSGRFCGVKDDASFLADIISLRSNKSAATKEMLECKALLGS